MRTDVPDWTILTGEYPPDCGGVGDYTQQVAAALAASGDSVTVACPGGSSPCQTPGVTVVALPDQFGRGSRRMLDPMLNGTSGPRQMLVQYVPNAFGARGANLAWCSWLLRRARRGDDVRVMFHEPYFYFEWARPDRSALAIVQRSMAAVLLRAARRVYFSTDAWTPYLQPFAPSGVASPQTLPIPSTVPPCEAPGRASDIRQRLTRSAGGALIGHFGTYGADIVPMLRATVPPLLAANASLSAVCVGDGSREFVADLVRFEPACRGRLHATGRLPPSDVASHLTACDLLVQPYPDGVTTRRTTVMAGLVNARPVLTTAGLLTESIWAQTAAVALSPAADLAAFNAAARALLANAQERAALAKRGEAAYQRYFSIERTIACLRDESGVAAA